MVITLKTNFIAETLISNEKKVYQGCGCSCPCECTDCEKCSPCKYH